MSVKNVYSLYTVKFQLEESLPVDRALRNEPLIMCCMPVGGIEIDNYKIQNLPGKQYNEVHIYLDQS